MTFVMLIFPGVEKGFSEGITMNLKWGTRSWKTTNCHKKRNIKIEKENTIRHNKYYY